MSKKTSFYLYSADHPDGRMFTETSEVREELEGSGEWFDHPGKVPGNDGDVDNSGQRQVRTATNTALNEQGSTGEPRYTLAEILATNARFFSVDQIAAEAAKHSMVLARVAEDSTLELVKPADMPNPPATPPIRRESNVNYDNEAVAAMILSGKTEPLTHQHFVTLAKALGVKHHKVKQADLIVKLKAVLEGAQPPQQDAGDGADDEAADDDEVVLGDDGKPVPPLQPKTD